MTLNKQHKLIAIASDLVGRFQLNIKDNTAGAVAAALITPNKNIYTGINMNINCGIGFCAEASAIAEMMKHRETQIDMIVAVHFRNKSIIAPCGRCRELIYQINKDNLNTEIIISPTETKRLKDLLPNIWLEQT